jgi:hypothetical protein
MKRRRIGWVILGAALVATGAAPAPAAEQNRLRVGAAAVKITPSLERDVYIAGYSNNRVADSIHDDLWARALVLDDGETRFAVVACDLIGLSNLRVRQIRRQVRSVPADNVLITCTHVHSGPDTLGLWGKNFTTTGIDPAYMQQLQERIVSAVDAAVSALKPVTMSAGTVDVPDGLVHNSRERLQDRQLTALRFRDAEGKTVASVVHYGGHPEVNKGRALTSDFVHYVREAAEKRFGGVALFLNGALGGMVTPEVSGHTFEEMQRVGEGVGRFAVQALEAAKPEPVSGISLRRRTVRLPLENNGFKLLLGAKVLEGELVEGGMETEVWRLDLGAVTWVTIPGEILPRPALALKEKMPGRYRMVVALGNDELGYILEPEDYDRDLYKYERSMSVGKQTWPLLFDAARELLK